MSMEDVLDDKEESPREETPEPEAKPEAPEPEVKSEGVSSKRAEFQAKEFDAQAEGMGKVRDPVTGQFVEKPKEEKPEAKEVKAPEASFKEEFSEKEKALLAAARDERAKRQELERRLKELETPKENKTFWDAPEEHLQSFRNELQGMITKTRLDTLESIARERHKDFDENVQEFAKVLQQTPGMQSQWLAAPDPAEYAYRVGKNHRELQEVGNLDALRAKIEKETRLRIEAELKEKEVQKQRQAASLPGSLSEVHGANPTKPVWSGPSSLDDIIAP